MVVGEEEEEEEEEWSHAVTTLILSSRLRATFMPRKETTFTKNENEGRETKGIVFEKDGTHT